ncbi:hypothetical protein [Actinophytocola oryzae]|nr:hypothetical protein [Actinophytocola oryzae]
MTIDNAEQAQITCGRPPTESFEFVIHREAIRALAELCDDALQQMDHLNNAEADRTT